MGRMKKGHDFDAGETGIDDSVLDAMQENMDVNNGEAQALWFTGAGKIIQTENYQDASIKRIALHSEVKASLAGITYKNALANGLMAFNQRGDVNSAARVPGGTDFDAASLPYDNSDDVYTLDRWNLLSDGNDIVDVSKGAASLPANAHGSLKSIVQTPNKKFGFIQILENADTLRYQGKVASYSFDVKMSAGAGLVNIKSAVVEWTGTADSVTSDLVSAWNITGTDPTLIANWAVAGAVDSTALSTSWQTISVNNQAVASGANNLALFIWTDDAAGMANDELEITNVQLEQASAVNTFEQIPIFLEELRVKRYFQWGQQQQMNWANASGSWPIPLLVPMRKTPSGQIWGWFSTNDNWATRSGNFEYNSGGFGNYKTGTFTAQDEFGAAWITTGGALATVDQVRCRWYADAEL